MATSPDPADPMLPVIARVLTRREEIGGVATLEIAAPGWRGFRPGQFNMLGRFGVGEVAISLSGDPASTGPAVHTIRDVGAVSHALAGLHPGDTLTLRGPFGTPWPVEAAAGRDVVVMAGGLGLAPVRPVLCQLMTHRDLYRRVTLLYGARGPQEILYAEELARWRARFDMEVEVTVDHAAPGWHGDVGVVPGLIGRAEFDPADTTAFVCGPEIMMRFSARGLTDAGVAAGSIFLSMERNMQCAVGLCGHCQLGPVFVCREGPVFDWATMGPLMAIKEL